MSTQAVTVREEYHQEPAVARFQLEQRMARLFVASGLFKDINGQNEEQSIAQAWVKIGLGASMGFSPAESMQGIDLIQGRPAVGAQLRAARMQRNGYDWTIEQCDAKGCKLTVFRGEKSLGQVSFMEEDAKSAGLIGKDNWKKDPASMYFARAITRAQRRFAPGVLSADVLSSEEAIDITPPIEERTNAKTQDLGKRLSAAATVAKLEAKKPTGEVIVEDHRPPRANVTLDADAPVDGRPAENSTGTMPGKDLF
jgi:hypothetical protein